MNPMPSPNRRQFLRAAGTLIALPWLESLAPAANPLPTNVDSSAKANRLVCIGAYLGLHTPIAYPKAVGADYELTPTLAPLAALRQDLTVLSGLDHRAGGGHGNWANYLCGKKVGDVSLDQRVAEVIGPQSRFPSFVLGVGRPPSMCYTHAAVALPEITLPSVFYRKMFASEADRKRTEYLLRSGRSSLDFVLEEAKALQEQVPASDRSKLDEYFTSLRDVETRLGRQIERVHDPVPKTEYRLPDADPTASNLMIECEELMYDLIALALQTDSSRVLSMSIGGNSEVFTIEGETLRFGYHALSHHGNDPDKVAELVKIDTAHMRSFARFLAQLKAKTGPQGRPLLDDTLVMWGTGMGDASRHSCGDLPTLVAGGGLKHGRHLAFGGNEPILKDRLMGDLFITLQRQMGIECESFCAAKQGLGEVLA